MYVHFLLQKQWIPITLVSVVNYCFLRLSACLSICPWKVYAKSSQEFFMKLCAIMDFMALFWGESFASRRIK